MQIRTIIEAASFSTIVTHHDLLVESFLSGISKTKTGINKRRKLNKKKKNQNVCLEIKIESSTMFIIYAFA